MKSEKIRIDDICKDCATCTRKSDSICYECATTIEKQLGRLNGIKLASVDYRKKTVLVEYNEKIVGSGAIVKNILETIRRFDNPK